MTAETPATFVSDHRDELVDLTLELLALETANPPGDTREIVDRIQRYVDQYPVAVERVAVDPAKPNLLVRLPGEDDETILYNGHTDTVPFDAEVWSHDPLGERVDDRLYGRGATDMKGPLAAMLFVIPAFVETGTTPPVDLLFAFVSDEEVGGSRPMLGENAIDRLYEAIRTLRARFGTRDLNVPPELEPIIEESVEYYAPTMGADGARELFASPSINLGTFDPVDEISEEDWQAIIDVNLSGIWRSMRKEMPVMLEDGGGTIVNTASILGQVGEAETPAYTAAKHGVVGLTKVAALERATDDIRVNAVCPGYIETQMLDDAGVTTDAEMRAEVEALHPMERLGTAEEIADAVLWLASDDASFVTGETLAIDGGYLSR